MQMTGIKLLLFFSLLVCFYTYLRFFRSVLLDRVIACGLVCVGALFVFVPGVTTSLAKLLGVGRGTDLVFYLFIVCTVFALILLYSKIVRTAIQQTELARYIAIREAESVRESQVPTS